MPRIAIAPFLLGAFFMLPLSAFAQDDSAVRSAQEQEAKQMKAAIDKGQAALRDFLHDQDTSRRIPPTAEAELKSRFSEFRRAIPKFREAVNQFRWEFSTNGKLDRHLKDIEDQSDVMLRYLSTAKMKHPRPDPEEFKGYSRNEFQWEFLSSAERISAYLDFAVKAEQQDVVSKKTLEFLFTLDGELQRLKWMSSRVK